MIEHKITEMSELSLKRLKNSSKGIVHSVYRKTINLKIKDRLLALQAYSSPLSPISIISTLDENSFENLNIEVGTEFSVCSNSIIIADKIFSFKDSIIVPQTNLKSLDKASQEKLIHTLEKLIHTTNRNSALQIFGKNSLFIEHDEHLPIQLQVLKRKLETSYKLYKSTDYKKSSEILSEIIGLGIGLTPTGDDFLCGILAGLSLKENDKIHIKPHLIDAITKNLNNTNDISREFLICATEGFFSRAVNNLLKLPNCREIENDFKAIGHSSGFDTLSGIYYILKI